MTHYPKAPIVEAAIDFHFAEKIPAKKLERSVHLAADNYPFSAGDDMINYKIDPVANKVHAEVLHRGFRLSSKDQSEIAIHRETNMIVSKLAPYGRWEDFVGRAKRDWTAFSKATNPGRIDRIGLRYINRIDVPKSDGEVIKVEDYLKIWPRLPDMGDEYRIDNYLMQIQRLLPDGFNLIINTAPAPSPLPNHASLFLDLDVYKTGLFQKKHLWDTLEAMRGHKNDTFERLITDKARELFA